MGHFIRILTRDASPLSALELREDFEDAALLAEVHVAVGTDEDWEQVVLKGDEGEEIAAIERTTGTAAADELRLLLGELDDAAPASAVSWLREYTKGVKSIFAFQVLAGARDSDEGAQALGAALDSVLSRKGGLVQDDSVGWTNDEGLLVLAPPPLDDEPGAYAVLVDGKWVAFELDPRDQSQVTAFRAGKVPAGSKRLPEEPSA